MKIESFEPKNESLKKYIKLIYFATHSENDENIDYLVFPNIYCIICFETKNELVNSTINAEYMKPLLFTYEGNINEITICFKPFGINTFLKKPLNFYLKDPLKFFPFDDYKVQMTKFLSIQNLDERLECIENYWLSKLNEFSHPFLNETIADILSKKTDHLSLKDIAQNNNISIKTLKNHFKKYIGKTPADFRKSVRFRIAIAEKNSSKDAVSLTNVSHASSFFDQAHMIKDFKALTGKTPKVFFANFSILHQGNIHFVFPKKG